MALVLARVDGLEGRPQVRPATRAWVSLASGAAPLIRMSPADVCDMIEALPATKRSTAASVAPMSS